MGWWWLMFKSNQRVVSFGRTGHQLSCAPRGTLAKEQRGKRSIGCWLSLSIHHNGAAVGSGPWGASFRVQPNLDCGGRGGLLGFVALERLNRDALIPLILPMTHWPKCPCFFFFLPAQNSSFLIMQPAGGKTHGVGMIPIDHHWLRVRMHCIYNIL